MRNRWTLIVAATVGIGGITLLGCDQDNGKSASSTPTGTAAAPADRATDKTDSVVDRSGAAEKRATERMGSILPSSESLAFGTLKDATDAAMTKGGFDDLVERLAKTDRERLHDYANGKNFDDLDAKVAQLQADWKAKYQNDFKIKDKEKVFADFVVFNEVKKEGFNTGSVTFPASHAMPEVMIPLESTGTSWKLDIPDTITGEQLKANLMKHLDMVESMKAEWPGDMNEGYRVVAHHIAAALMGKD